jgi:MFS family permease
VPGLALFAATAIGLLLWITFGGHRFAWLSGPSIGLAAATLTTGALLARREWRVAAPFLPVELLRDRGIAVVAVTVLLFAACFYGVVFFLPIYLQLGHGNSATASGLLLLPLTFGMVSGATLTGRTIARTGRPSRLPAYGMAISAGALLALAVLPAQPLLVGAMGLLCGLGFGTVMPTSQVVIQTLAGRARLGAAAAVVSLARSLGSALGTACFAAVAFGLMHGIDLAAAARAATPEHAAGIVGAMRMLFGAVAATAAVTALWAARAPRLQI